MRNPVRRVSAALLGCLFLFPTLGQASSAEEFERVLQDVQELTEGAKYDQALERLKQASTLAADEAQDAATVLYEGLLLASLGAQQFEHAETAFDVVLRRDPKAKLPLKASFEVERAFEKTRAQVMKEKTYLTPPVWNMGSQDSTAPASTDAATVPSIEPQDLDRTLREIRESLTWKEYELARERLQKAHQLVRQEEQHTAVMLYEGLILASLGRHHQAQALGALRTALQQEPGAKLPVKVPFQVEQAFEELRTHLFAPESAPDLLDNPFIKEHVASDEK
ncbi:hypothetical protein [Hyalangium rubrum]|uniref:Tetratricopeptide repeat protein n=1 Tax=Hyalangium rubrum TaxID=3103134 RepID=A0ABU5HEY4_9BACT|nr:hypothetical protein [Hyalangium sp. s54d21]MDY7231825.1 hypothetical protein [Hyalangium sp. s54d21]